MISIPFIEFVSRTTNITHWIRVSSRRHDAMVKAVTMLSSPGVGQWRSQAPERVAAGRGR